MKEESYNIEKDGRLYGADIDYHYNGTYESEYIIIAACSLSHAENEAQKVGEKKAEYLRKTYNMNIEKVVVEIG